MIGGLKKTTSRLAIAAAAGMLAAAAGGYATQAVAADLGGNCCTDLEERIAELEATTARKGNRKVSLTVYGHVNEMVLFWDDGDMNDVYQVTNDVSRTRFGFRGSAKIDSDLSAGYRIEIGVRTANSAAVNQFVDPDFDVPDDGNFNPGDDIGNGLDLRHAFWYIQSQHWGTVTVGQTDTPSSSTFALTLANIPMMEGDPSGMGAGFFLRATDGTLVDAIWADLMHPTQGSLSRRNEVMYTTPTWNGFQSQVAWGEDDFWAVSLAWAGEHHGFRAAIKMAYADMSDPTFSACESEGGFFPSNQASVDCNHFAVGASVMHVATGLFVSGGYVTFEDNNRADDLDDNDEAWWVHAGIEQKWHSFGKTTLYAEYGEQQNGNTGFSGTTMSFWGLGAVQNIEAAAMDLYIFYRQLSAEEAITADFFDGVGLATDTFDIDDFHMVGVGAIIRF
jgi:predicted porin